MHHCSPYGCNVPNYAEGHQRNHYEQNFSDSCAPGRIVLQVLVGLAVLVEPVALGRLPYRRYQHLPMVVGRAPRVVQEGGLVQDRY